MLLTLAPSERPQCDKEGEDGPLCYREMGWIENYLNQADVQAELGMRGASGATCLST